MLHCAGFGPLHWTLIILSERRKKELAKFDEDITLRHNDQDSGYFINYLNGVGVCTTGASMRRLINVLLRYPRMIAQGLDDHLV
jgi:hypothetical protein